ncbi:hypothetical protein GCM10027089_01440 [Nocardia thraciensis]
MGELGGGADDGARRDRRAGRQFHPVGGARLGAMAVRPTGDTISEQVLNGYGTGGLTVLRQGSS